MEEARQPSAAPQEAVEFLDALQGERSRLSNAVERLQESIAQLKAAIQQNGPDADYKMAIEVLPSQKPCRMSAACLAHGA